MTPLKGKALRRALTSSDAIRINAKVPLIVDSTELITPAKAQEMLQRNRKNRPVNWKKVEEYSDIMRAGQWQLHAQGIILDPEGNIITGQTRLWAVVYSDSSVYMRISKGTPAHSANVIDRGRPQSARDLASRKTEKKHSPTEASISRAICVLRGITRPSIDDVARILVEKSEILSIALLEAHGTQKTKAVLMILAAIVECANSPEQSKALTKKTSRMSEKLDESLLPHSAKECWNKGTAFGIALEQARKIVLG